VETKCSVPVGKIAKKQSEGVQIQCYVVKNTLLQTAFFGDSAHWGIWFINKRLNTSLFTSSSLSALGYTTFRLTRAKLEFSLCGVVEPVASAWSDHGEWNWHRALASVL